MACVSGNRCIDEGSDSLDLLCQCAGTIANLAEDARNQVIFTRIQFNEKGRRIYLDSPAGPGQQEACFVQQYHRILER